MSPYENALLVDGSSSDRCLASAAELLERCQGVVVLDGMIALSSTPTAILCEVIDPLPAAHRCAEEFRVLVENAARRLARSRLAGRLPRRPLEWQVVEDRGSGTVKLWSGT